MWHYVAMTNMEMLLRTALYLNLFLAQRLTTGLCQGTMPAIQGRQPFQTTSLSSHVMAESWCPDPPSKTIPNSAAIRLGCSEIGQSCYTLPRIKVDVSIKAQELDQTEYVEAAEF